MSRALLLASITLLLALPTRAEDYVLPVFAYRVAGAGGSQWTSDVYVTNPGPKVAMVVEGSLLPGRISSRPPCMILVQPFLSVPPRTTLHWTVGNLALGIGCPEFAVGGLTFRSDLPVEITSRMINHSAVRDGSTPARLTGLGQEIPAFAVNSLPTQKPQMILPAIGWHPNSCGSSELDTNVFFTNPTATRVTVNLEPAPDQPAEMLIDGVRQTSPFVFSVAPFSQRTFRLAGPDTPMLPVCLQPVVGSFSYRADGPIAVVASIIDRTSGDPRTSLPVRAID